MSIEKRLEAIEARNETEQGEKQAEEIREYLSKDDKELIKEYVKKHGLLAFESLFLSVFIDVIQKRRIKFSETITESRQATYPDNTRLLGEALTLKENLIDDLSETLDYYGCDIKKQLVSGIMGVTL